MPNYDPGRITHLEDRLAVGSERGSAQALSDLEMLADLYLQADSYVPALARVPERSPTVTAVSGPLDAHLHPYNRSLARRSPDAGVARG